MVQWVISFAKCAIPIHVNGYKKSTPFDVLFSCVFDAVTRKYAAQESLTMRCCEHLRHDLPVKSGVNISVVNIINANMKKFNKGQFSWNIMRRFSI
jgi:hypothetical protein